MVRPSSDVKNEPVFGLHEAPDPQQKCGQRSADPGQNDQMPRHPAVVNQIPELSYIEIHRIEMLNEPLERFRERFHRIENRRQIRPGRGDCVVDELAVTEKHIGLCQEQTESQAKNVQLQQNAGKQQRVPGHLSSGDQKHNDQCPQREQQVNQSAGNLRNGENVLGNVGFFHQCRVVGYGKNCLMGGLVHKIEQKLAAEQVDREILDIALKHIGKHQGHHGHDHQGVQDTPKIPQEAAAVFELDVLDDKQSQQITVDPEAVQVSG